MTVFRGNISYITTLIVFLGCFIWSVNSLADECISANNRRGVCRTFSNCPTNSSAGAGLQPVICRVKNDIAYICCELTESELTESEESVEVNKRREDSSDSEDLSSEDDEVDDKYYRTNRNRGHKNAWGRGMGTDYYNKAPGISKGADAHLYYPSPKQPIWSQTGETSNTYHFSNDKDTYYTDYHRRKPQGTSQFNEWNQPNQQRPQIINSGNSNIGWQENPNDYYNTRRTTERPRTTTSRIIHPADFRPNPAHNFNKLQNPSYVPNRPSNFNSEGSRPSNFNSEGSRPSNFNSEGTRPSTFNPEGSRPSNFNSQGSRPSNFNSQGSRPSNFNSQGSRPSNFNSQGSRPNNQISKPKRISELKCEEYAEAVTLKVLGLPLTPDPKPITISVGKCISAQQLIVGGENTTVGEFPHMAAIGFRDRNSRDISWKCGGSLISEQYVLTAAHCTTSERKPVKVRLGEYNLKTNNDGAYPEDYSIQEIINHPDYKKPAKYNDIALLKLSRRVEIRRHIRPACLHIHRDIPDPKVIAIGWGRVERNEDVSDTLLKVALNVIDKNTCNRAYSHFTRQNVLPQGIIDTQLCAGELAGGKDTCQGDSGGPIEIISKSNKCLHYIVGVTSFGRQCALANSPGVYTRVSAFIPWIESIVWPQ